VKTLKLVRTKSDNKQTIGELWFEGKRIAYTLELPWRENQRRVSCIPKGVYEVIEHQAPSYPKAKSYWVQNVPARTKGALAAYLKECMRSSSTKPQATQRRKAIGCRTYLTAARYLYTMATFTATLWAASYRAKSFWTSTRTSPWTSPAAWPL